MTDTIVSVSTVYTILNSHIYLIDGVLHKMRSSNIQVEEEGPCFRRLIHLNLLSQASL